MAQELDITGGLTINRGATVSNSGTIIVENVGGVVPSDFDPWETGLLVYGALDNAGTITIENVYDGPNVTGTEGISTFYNYGLIGGGVNKGICIDEDDEPRRHRLLTTGAPWGGRDRAHGRPTIYRIRDACRA